MRISLNARVANAAVAGSQQLLQTISDTWDGERMNRYLAVFCVLCRPQLVDVDLGSSAPVIRGVQLSACPGSGALPAPQLQLDLSYEVSLRIRMLVYTRTTLVMQTG
jgi:hypothetical protein